MRACSAILMALAFVLVAASPASANLVKLARGGYANFAPVSSWSATHTARNFDSAFSNLDYSGGPVMSSNTNYAVVWQPSGYAGTAFQPGYVSGVGQFLADLAASSGSASATDSVSSQYRDAEGDDAAFNSTYGGTYTDTDPLPSNGCPAASGHICLTDSQLQTELDAFLASHGLPHDLAHEYFLLTPPGVASCFDATGAECSANADESLAYCAYHGESSAGYLYANIPDLSGVDGCDPYVTSCPVSMTCLYNNGPADGVLSAVSHEHNESVTDPEPNNAWTDWQPGCAQSTCGGEIGDKCNGDGFDDPHLQPQANGTQETPYNQTLNGRHYLLQMEWSNQGHACVGGFTSDGTTVSAAFTDSPGSGDTVNFDAGASTSTASIAEYVWQFNDGPGQNSTVETTSPTISHTFGNAGLYDVALTVLAQDGTSGATAATLDVGGASSPVGAFGLAPGSVVPGTPVAFNATASSDPNAGGAITSYTWNFGDGTTASGATATHAFSQVGAQTVTLTVTDSAGLIDSVSHTVTVTGAPPTAAFSISPPSAQAGAVISFSAAASTDPGGTINSYGWTLGDGTTAHGSAASHIYSAAGVYTVTLSVTGSDGQTGQVSHTVTITAASSSQPPSTPPSTGGSHNPPSSPRCTVPRLVGKSLSQATKALHAAHCKLGTVHKPRHKPRQGPGKHKHWALVVVATSARSARREPSGSKVSLTLGYRAVRN